MMTPEQMEKAKRALRDAESKKLVKQIMFRRRQRSMELAERFCLPYRVVLGRGGCDADERPLTIYYPLPGLPRSSRQQTADCIKVKTEQDAKYFLTRFIRYERFDEYRDFDFTGNRLSGDELETVKNEFIERQRDYASSLGTGRYFDHILFPNLREKDDTEKYYCIYL